METSDWRSALDTTAGHGAQGDGETNQSTTMARFEVPVLNRGASAGML
jgi:hypothetical protein